MTFICLALAWLAGFGLVRWVFPAPLRWSLHNALLFSLASGVGIGLASSVYFLTLAFAGPNVLVIAALEAAVVVAALTLGFTAKPRTSELDFSEGPATPRYLTVLFLLAAALAATMFVVYSLAKPHGDWDAWSIWNMRARFLFRAGEFWKDAFSSQIPWTHPDYPLLIPGISALCWTLAKAESTSVPVAVAFLFIFGAAGVLTATIGILRGRTQAFVAGALLLGTVSFVQIGAMQYADVPLSFFMLATLALLCLEDRYPGNARFGLLAGVTAGFAAWTKNEGQLFVVAVLAARAITLWRFGRTPLGIRRITSVVAGLVGPLAVVAFFKLRFAPPNDLLSKSRTEILQHLVDPARWITTLEGFVKGAFGFGSFLVPIVVALVVYWYLVRFNTDERDKLSVATISLAVAFMLAGDLGVYVLLSGDVNWQIGASIDRILLQVWPAGLLAFFMAASPLQVAAAKPEIAEKHKPAKRAPQPRKRAAETH